MWKPINASNGQCSNEKVDLYTIWNYFLEYKCEKFDGDGEMALCRDAFYPDCNSFCQPAIIRHPRKLTLIFLPINNVDGPQRTGTRYTYLIREGIKKTFFLGDLSQIWVGGGADSQTFGDIYQPLFFSTKVPKCGWVGQSKPKTKSKFWVKFIKCI